MLLALFCALLSTGSSLSPAGNVLILDHVNLNHPKGGHDALKRFYFETLGLACDPRKEDNLAKGRKTLWANAGATQLHLPEANEAQVLDGQVTLAYDSLDAVRQRLEMQGFGWRNDGEEIVCACPWGTSFRLVAAQKRAEGLGGAQPGPASEALGIVDVTLHIPKAVSVAAVARFYAQIVGAETTLDGEVCRVQTGPTQTLTFAHRRDGAPVLHDDRAVDENGQPQNLGPHVSMYLADMEGAYDRAAKLGLCYVNHRFSRRAYSLEEAREQCMFRILDVVDPDDPKVRLFGLEHELRSATKIDGSKYKSCPLFDV
ncbi:hypothetical protein M885DRAFT_480311 [Pelagophyceae sp. CCMP2097]|nr:hypothetical protein M885DRAFT_480311 [Pelagophyceae sp. CCMP2097]|mmetsp:Transcript_26101/g.87717  ORF Transcript_26101/g.87717 Transcript_26101/m.87717 type:complete len:315 (-) Transcript_26101:28-972(-)